MGMAVLLLDVIKGALPVLISRALPAGDWTLALAGLAAFVGHIFPVFAGFKGGKGVATAAGAFAVLAPAVLGGALVVFTLAFAAWRIVSVASMLAGLSLPVLAALLTTSRPVVLIATLIAIAIVMVHRENLLRLRAGQEPRFRVRD